MKPALAVKPVRPVMPEGRTLYESLSGPKIFDSEAELKEWKSEPLWRRFFGFTARDRRIASQRKKARV